MFRSDGVDALTNEEQTLLTALREIADEQGVVYIRLTSDIILTVAGLMAKGRIWKRTVKDGEMICHLCGYE